jgi:hypothetical protein
VDDTAPIRSDVQLHPEAPVAALAGLLHLSGSRAALAFLVELGVAMMVASTMVPSAATTAVLQQAGDRIEDRLVSPVALLPGSITAFVKESASNPLRLTLHFNDKLEIRVRLF